MRAERLREASCELGACRLELAGARPRPGCSPVRACRGPRAPRRGSSLRTRSRAVRRCPVRRARAGARRDAVLRVACSTARARARAGARCARCAACGPAPQAYRAAPVPTRAAGRASRGRAPRLAIPRRSGHPVRGGRPATASVRRLRLPGRPALPARARRTETARRFGVCACPSTGQDRTTAFEQESHTSCRNAQVSGTLSVDACPGTLLACPTRDVPAPPGAPVPPPIRGLLFVGWGRRRTFSSGSVWLW